MSLLFYLNQQNNKKGVNDFLIFLTEFTVQSKKDVIVLCESDFDFNQLESHHELAEKPTIIKLYSNDIATNETKNFSKLKFNSEFLFNIEKNRFKNIKSVPKTVSKIVTALEVIIFKHNIEACHFTVIGGVYRSVGMFVLQEILNQKSIKSYMVFSTPIKGRFMIYDDIYLKNKKFEHTYNSLINDGINKKDINKINKYFNDYLKFKKNRHLPFLIKRREKLILNELLIKKILKKIIILIRQGFILTKSKSRHSNRPYILFLLSKNNHWFTSFANPELLDRKKLVETVYASIPKDYDLVVKSHPHIIKDPLIEKIAKKKKNCYFYYDNPTTHELVNYSSIVISVGTTAGVEALIQNKHVIELGDRPPYFNFHNPPVNRLNNLDNIVDEIKDCIKAEVPVEKIYIYFNALLKCSYPKSSDYRTGTFLNRNNNYYKLSAQVLFDHISNEKLL